MHLVDDFRHSQLLQSQLTRLRKSVSRRWVIMDVCGGQTHALLRYGLEDALDDMLELIHGPGCPVCVTPGEVIAEAIALANDPNVVLVSFGDMLRVPGPTGSLVQARAKGADVRMVYSPLDAVKLAATLPAREVVFFAVGFETTAPATALAVLQAQKLGLRNFRVLAHHVRVEPGMRAILENSKCRVQAFLAAGHVCTVTGFAHYQQLVTDFQTPIVVTGFEPVDLLAGLTLCAELLESGRAELRNAYARSARFDGNAAAQRLIANVFEIDTLPWRGLGPIRDGGLSFRSEFEQFDARRGLSRLSHGPGDDVECRSGDVLSGLIKPPACPLFGNACMPDQPRGAPMVSSEGACAAYFRYGAATEVTRG